MIGSVFSIIFSVLAYKLYTSIYEIPVRATTIWAITI